MLISDTYPFLNLGWLLPAIGLLVFVYLFGMPLVIKAGYAELANPILRIVDPDLLPLPTDVEEHFDRANEVFSQIGFKREAIMFLPQSANDVMAIFVLYINRQTMESAIAASLYRQIYDFWELGEEYIEFATRFKNDIDYETYNAKTINVHPKHLDVVKTQVPWITDTLKLYQLHQQITYTKGHAGQRVLLLDSKYDGDPCTYIADDIQKSLENARRAGFFYLTTNKEHYRMTLKGAYLMTWQLMPPFKKYVVWNREQRTKRFLEGMGIET